MKEYMGLDGTNYMFPFHLFSPGDRIVIYGIERLAIEFKRQAEEQKYVDVVRILKETARLSILKCMQYDAILLAVMDYPSASKLQQELIKFGIRSEKIRWDGVSYTLSGFLQGIYFPLLHNAGHCSIEFDNPHGKAEDRNRENDVLHISDFLQDFEQFEALPVAVDIAIPIYNAYEYTRVCINSVLQNTTSPYNLYLVDDCSTDTRIHEMLMEVKGKESPKHLRELCIMEHEENKGFLRTMNEVMSATKNHLVIVNSDTEVPRDWLQRLMRPIMEDDMVASVTPTTNSSSICSFPKFGYDNKLLEKCSLADMDRVFSCFSGRMNIQLLMGAGFCMAMNRKALDAIGHFNPIFGKGYGEESDWCLRAASQGWKHVWCLNLFIYHKHGASFGNAAKTEKKEHKIILHDRYPHLDRQNFRFLVSREWQIAYDWAYCLFNVRKSGKEGLVVYLNSDKKIPEMDGSIVVRKMNSGKILSWKMYWNEIWYEFRFWLDEIDVETIKRMFLKFKVREVVTDTRKMIVSDDVEEIYQCLQES